MLREQELLLREQIKASRAAELAEGAAIAGTLADLLSGDLELERARLTGGQRTLSPHAASAIARAYEWSRGYTYDGFCEDPETGESFISPLTFSETLAADDRLVILDTEQIVALASAGRMPDSFATRPELDGFIRAMHAVVTRTVRSRAKPSVPLAFPDNHPPRHGRLQPGRLARLVADDISEHITEGRALAVSLDESAAPRWPRKNWVHAVRGSLQQSLCPEVADGFAEAAGWPDGQRIRYAERDWFLRFTDTRPALDQAYLALGIAYLEEVQERMPDYAEASGQDIPEARVSMSISGGTFIGGQFAGQIANVDSTIAGIVQHGQEDMGQALLALKQAVLSQPGLDDEQRGDLLDSVEYLAEAAQAPPEKRKRGIVKSALTALNAAAITGSELSRALDAWGAVLHKLIS